VWVSEIMLQQTTVTTVIPYFHRFIERFSCVQDLAAASLEEVFFLWQGLGYYRRAAHLHKAALALAEHGFPQTQQQWMSLPGIGPYTSAAIMAIAFDQPAVAIDGNIERVMSRYHGHGDQEWLKKVAQSARECLPAHRYGDYTQALMDLGSQICRPKTPLCDSCPLQEGCYACQHREIERFPPVKKRIKNKRYGHVYVLYKEEEGNLLIALTKESPNSLLKELWGFPTTLWQSEATAPPLGKWIAQGKVRHVFTHFDLELSVWVGKSVPFESDEQENRRRASDLSVRIEKLCWVSVSDLHTYALSRLMRKVQTVFTQAFVRQEV
jgi:A/G-specific adenine glycosylase